MHPDDAAVRSVGAGDWVLVRTPHGEVRARARLNPAAAPGVVCAQHGWSAGCAEVAV